MARLSIAACSLFLVASWLASNHYPPWVTAHSELMAALAALSLGLAGALTLAKHSRIQVPKPAVFFALLAAIPLLQAACGLTYFFGDAWTATLYLLCAAWCVTWSWHAAAAATVAWVEWLAGALFAGALLSSIVQHAQRWGLDLGPLGLYIAAVRPGAAPFANLAQPNLAADLFALGIASAALLFERRRLSWVMALAAAVLFTLGLVMTQSRTPLLLFIVGIAWHAHVRQRLSLRTPAAAPIGLALGWVAGFLAWPSLLQTEGIQVAASTASRLQAGPRTVIYQQMWDAVWLHPWAGYGWNQVSVAQIAVAADHPRSRLIEHSHNLLLDLMLWNGVPLALLITAASAWWLYRIARRVHSVDGAFGLLAALLLLAHSMVEFPLEFLYFLVPFAMALGIAAQDAGDRPALMLSRGTGWGGVTVFAALTAMASIDYWHVEEAYRTMRFTVARYGRPMSTEAPPELRTEFTQLAAFHRFSLTMPRAGMNPSELEWMRRVAHRYGYAPSLYRYALAQGLNGDASGAQLTMIQLRQLHGDERYLEGKQELERRGHTDAPSLSALNLP
jgi:O-antigen ligase